MTDPIVLAYLAGAIDADGFVTIQKNTPSAHRLDGAKVSYYVARLGLTETDATIPNLLKATFGGWLKQYAPRNERCRPIWVWQVCNLQASQVAKQLLPYLRLKGPQALLLLELQKLGRGAMTRDAKADLYRQVTMLNRPTNRRRHRPDELPWAVSVAQ